MPIGKQYFRAAVWVLGLSSILLIPGRLWPAEELPFTAEELARLERGEVVLRHVGKPIAEKEFISLLVGAVWVPHPLEVIWEVLDHPEREIEWIPHVKQSQVTSDLRPTPTTRVNVTDYRIGVFGIEAYYSLVREYDYQKKTIKAHLDKNRPRRFFEDIQAGWNFYPYRGGVIFQYWSDSKLVFEVPAFLSQALTERAVIAGIAAVKQRCDQVALERKDQPKPAPARPEPAP